MAAPVLSGGPPGSWDEKLREKVWVLEENGIFKMWYVGHTATGQQTSKVGYATSTDGITWTKYAGNPVVNRPSQDQDICVVKTAAGVYDMYIEVGNDHIDLMTSTDGIAWTAYSGNPVKTIAASPVVWREGSSWFMLYEDMHPPIFRIHLATSPNGLQWTDSPGNPVLAETSDTVPDSVVKEGSLYHLYYHRGDTDITGLSASWPAWHATSTNLTSWTNRARVLLGMTSQSTFRTASGEIRAIFWNLDGDEKYYLRYGVSLPVAYHWRFDEGTGSTTDESTNHVFYGTRVNGAAWTTGRFGSAIQFDGVDDFVAVGFNRDLPTYTVAAWVRGNSAPSSAQATGPIHREKNFQINWNHPDPTFRGAAAMAIGGNWYAASFGPLVGGRWYHLAITYDGDTLKSYKDGVLVTANTAPTGAPDAEEAYLRFGRNAGRDYFFAGAVDDVYLYDRALTATEIAALATPDATPPTGVTLSGAPAGQSANLSWTAGSDPESGISAYRIYRDTVPGSSRTLLTQMSGATLTYTDSSTAPSTTYYYEVTAVNGGGVEGPTSNEVSILTGNAPPAAPTGLTGAPGNQQAALDWNDNTEPDLAGYRVRRSTTSGGPYTLITGTITASAYTDTILTNGQPYYYVVTAVDTAGNESPFSAQVSVTPVNFNSTLVAYWPLDDGSGNQAAEVRGGMVGTLVGGPVWTTGRMGGGLRLDGINDVVTTGFTSQLANWTISLWVQSPAAPSSALDSGPISRERNFQINWNHTEATFRGAAAVSVNGVWYAASFGTLQPNTWYHLAATYDGETLRSYRDGVLVTANTAPSGAPDVESNPLVMGRASTANQFFAGTIDDVRVDSRALSASEIAALIVTDTTPPSVVTLSATPSGQSVQLSWTASSDPESGVTQYRIYRATSSGTTKPLLTQVAGSVLSYLDNTTSPSTTYYYQVSAVNGGSLEGARSNEASALTGNTPPAAPTGVSAVAGNAQVALDWADNVEADLAGYRLYRSTTSGGPYTQITGALLTVSAYTDSTVVNGQTYYYVVTAVDTGNASSPNSQQVSATPVDRDPALLASWLFDEGAGTFAADSVGTYHGTLVGGPTWTTAGRHGGALTVDGVNDYVNTPFTTDLPTWTVALWVRSPAAPSSGSASGPVHRETAFQITWNHPEPSFRGATALRVNGNWYSASFGPLQANTWYHLVGTYDGTTLRAYRDGVLISSTSVSGLPDVFDLPMTMGKHARVNNFFAGTIDDVQIYSRALSAAEVAGLAAR